MWAGSLQALASAAAQDCCEMVHDAPSLYVIVILFFILCAVLALTGLLALMMD